jgi:hypothetical protein
MGEAAALLGLGGVTFDFGGRRWPVGERTLDVEALFENYLEGRALDAVRRHRARLSEDEYKLQLAAWQEACAAGAYAWGEPAAERALAYLGSPGWRELAYLQLKAADPGATRDLADEVCKDPAATRELHEALRRASDPLARNGRGPGPSPPSAPSSSAAATAGTAPAGSAG